MDPVSKITYLSRLDNSMQTALFRAAAGSEPRPLAVCLHTWSYGAEPPYDHFVKQCQVRNWHFIFPHFRGPNKTPESCGSDLVVSDLECAIEYVRANFPLDEKRIYLVGGSGGGHASSLMAGRSPELWTAISSWCPICDLISWFKYIQKIKPNPEDRSYDYHIMEACGGDPVSDKEARSQALYRSPNSWLPRAKGKVIYDIWAGIHDMAVPCSQAIRSFNLAAAPQDQISEELISYIENNQKIPEELDYKPHFTEKGKKKILFSKISGNVRLVIFEGGHSIHADLAFSFLEQQERGKAPVWEMGSYFKESDIELTK